EDAGGVLERGGITGKAEDEEHPQNDRQPVPGEVADFLHVASKQRPANRRNDNVRRLTIEFAKRAVFWQKT
ncbi:MAG TPA: hypothetical protein VN048_02755, partial [Verrucomicrobiae bacterium]|nr:hypothetical protein [Verrucomicrobiae bacterium]